MTAFPLVVRRGSIETDAMVRIEVAANDPAKAARLLGEAYAEAMSKLGAVMAPGLRVVPAAAVKHEPVGDTADCICGGRGVWH